MYSLKYKKKRAVLVFTGKYGETEMGSFICFVTAIVACEQLNLVKP